MLFCLLEGIILLGNWQSVKDTTYPTTPGNNLLNLLKNLTIPPGHRNVKNPTLLF